MAAVSFLSRDVSELCLGKPALRSLPISATVAEALSALKRSGERCISIWSSERLPRTRSSADFDGEYRCVGKVCMVDVICFLCRSENLLHPSIALQSPVSVLLPKVHGLVRHLEPQSSLLEAIDHIIEGAQNLVVPAQNHTSIISGGKKLLDKPPSFGYTLHQGREFCWLTQEDVIRFFVNSITTFSPIPTFAIGSLNMIDTNIMTVHYHDPASSALPFISHALTQQTSIAVIDDDSKLIGEISPLTLSCCDETASAAIATLSAGELMAYIDCGDPPEDLVQLVKARLGHKNLRRMLEFMEEISLAASSSSPVCSSDDEFGPGSNRYNSMRGSGAIVCHSWSSLMAVMIQAITHRVNYVWVVEEDHTLVGTVTFAGILKVFRRIAGVWATHELISDSETG
ncbi:CBS domain-containing protein CBSX5-like [Cornus florida]|uniref:CBS domain-containing protein CBSX5-like n=1 Tax=Cornus florida TaxID=4283 RepID=UPI00289656D8|nr:CBS domain-containing protein CBSX5-like [Cornus florida]